jgi:hypothetical protein
MLAMVVAPTVAPTLTAAATPSPAPTIEPSPTAPEPTPTLFYIVPQQVEIDPTPQLPAAAPFPSSCDGPGRINLLLIGIDGFSNDFLIVDAYSVNDSISVTLADTSGRGRPSVSRGPTGVSTPPPPPIVALSFGAACANVPNCHKVVSTASNFPASSRCHLEDSMNTPSTATGSSTSFAWWTQGNGSVTTVNWVGTYPSSYWIKIVCDNGAVSPVHYGGS